MSDFAQPKTYPIVGMRFRPPAQALTDTIAVGTPLVLLAEPTNPYDPNAVAVWLYSRDIPEGAHATLEALLPRFGTDLETVLATEVHHLGYIPKDLARDMKEKGVIDDTTELRGTFCTNAAGGPQVRLET